MKIFFSLLAILSAFTVFADADFKIPAKNFINEGDFSQSGKNWHFFDTRAGSFLKTGGPDGGPCFKITNGAANYVYLYNKGTRRGWGVDLEEGKTYTLSAWMKTENLDLKTLHRNSPLFVTNYGWRSSICLAPKAGTSDWQRYSVTFQAPKQVIKVPQTANGYNMLFFWPPKAKGTLYLANIQLEEGSKATDFTNFCNLSVKSAVFRQQELVNALQKFSEAVKGTAVLEKLAAQLKNELDDTAQQLSNARDAKTLSAINSTHEEINRKLTSASSRIYLKHAFALTSQDDLPEANDKLVPQNWVISANSTRSITLMVNNFTGSPRDYRISFSDFVRTETNEAVSADKFSKLYFMPLLRGLHAPDKLFTDLLADAGKFGMLTVPSGCTRMMTLSINSQYLMPGTYKGKLLITDLADSRRSSDVPFTLQILPVALPEKAPFTIGPFGQRRMNKLNSSKLGNNLQILDVVGFEGRVDRNGNLYPTDYTALHDAVKQALSVDKNCKFMLLFASGVRFYRNAEKAGIKWNDPRAKKAWQKWCKETCDEFVKLGVSPKNVYLQVADEPGGGTAKLLAEMQKLAKEAAPEMRLTTTLTGFDIKTPGNREFFKSLDHVVLTTKTMFGTPEALKFFRENNIEIANYDCWSVMETIDPTAYCRRQMICAWQNKLSGCFYWFRDDRQNNYSAVNSMSVVYPRRDGDIMRTAGPLLDGEEFDISRRYLAYQAGVDDIKLIAMLESLAEKYPDHAAAGKVNTFFKEFYQTSDLFYSKSQFPRYSPQGHDPALLDKLHVQGVKLAAELLKNDNFQAESISLENGKLKISFNSKCSAVTVYYRVNGSTQLEQKHSNEPTNYIEFDLAGGNAEVNYCRIKAVSSNGKVIECSPFIRAKVTADSCFNGYNIHSLNDGVRVPGAGYFTMLCWIAAANSRQHWVKLDWQTPQTVSEVKLFWMTRNGPVLARKIETLQRGVWREAVPESPATSAVETLRFKPVQATAIRVVIPAGKGARYAPAMVGLSEIEVR